MISGEPYTLALFDTAGQSGNETKNEYMYIYIFSF
jgi:hypothetical protein